MTERERAGVLRKVVDVVERKFVDPKLNGTNFQQAAEARRNAIVSSATQEDFEREMNALLQTLRTSHTGFFHERKPRSAGRIAISASFLDAETPDGRRWVFQDVHPGGVAAQAGIAPGDILLTVNGRESLPPVIETFTLGSDYAVAIRKRDGSTTAITLRIPNSNDKKRPLIVPSQVVSVSKVDRETGHLRVSMFPGALGIDVARDMQRAAQELEARRLIVDLRGNTGGGIGCLRLMSLLCSDRRGVGYSVGRARMEEGYRKERLPAFDRIPASRLGILPLIVRFATAQRSVGVYTEALGKHPFHGRVALLVNEHSASAAEMVAAFAADERLAAIVGTKSAGRLVGANSFKVSLGYRVALPIVKYFTWHDQSLEGVGVAPSVPVAVTAEQLRAGEDPQLDAAVRALE